MWKWLHSLVIFALTIAALLSISVLLLNYRVGISNHDFCSGPKRAYGLSCTNSCYRPPSREVAIRIQSREFCFGWFDYVYVEQSGSTVSRTSFPGVWLKVTALPKGSKAIVSGGNVRCESVGFILSISMYYVAIATSIYPLIFWTRRIRRIRRIRQTNRPCKHCLFDLTGNLSGVCANCGQDAEIATTNVRYWVTAIAISLPISVVLIWYVTAFHSNYVVTYYNFSLSAYRAGYAISWNEDLTSTDEMRVDTQKTNGPWLTPPKYLKSPAVFGYSNWVAWGCPSARTVVVPHALMLAGACFMSVLILRLSRQRQKTICMQCGYDLQGNESGVCPECGEAVEVAA